MQLTTIPSHVATVCACYEHTALSQGGLICACWPTQLWVQVNASNFCIETQLINASDPLSDVFCPTWAGGKVRHDNIDQVASEYNHV